MSQNTGLQLVARSGLVIYCIATYLIDVAINNVWIIQCTSDSEDTLDFLAFNRGKTRTYLERFESPQKYLRQRRPSNRLDDSRFGMYSYWIVLQNVRTRCAHNHMKTTRREK